MNKDDAALVTISVMIASWKGGVIGWAGVARRLGSCFMYFWSQGWAGPMVQTPDMSPPLELHVNRIHKVPEKLVGGKLI